MQFQQNIRTMCILRLGEKGNSSESKAKVDSGTGHSKASHTWLCFWTPEPPSARTGEAPSSRQAQIRQLCPFRE